MDRLICGDVGYGKTEVALRAAFKAVEDGKQVMFLVPTTVLAQQHFGTFTERMRDYPVRIEVASRFRSAKEVRDALKGFSDGTVDVMIGTHRLLSRDVRPKDLGLLIVDEEQRFGVKQKELLRQLRLRVDVLSLSATPIPRTLQMSLAGLRDISVIETPPEGRRPVKTYVGDYDEELVKRAIEREVEREGQAFFIHNRVSSIDETAERVRAMVPKARVLVAHGQMPEGELEQVMLDFLRGAADVLVCTTIVESGLDIPSANTLIVERADELGLAQLYQIRGRVGRSRERAYAYLLYPSAAALSEEAAQRLSTLSDYTELGSGFKIAMRDLEIRGAGNLLGRGPVGARGGRGLRALHGDARRGGAPAERRLGGGGRGAGAHGPARGRLRAGRLRALRGGEDRAAPARGGSTRDRRPDHAARGARGPLRARAGAARQPDQAPGRPHQAGPRRRAGRWTSRAAASRSRRSSSTRAERALCARPSRRRCTSPGAARSACACPRRPPSASPRWWPRPRRFSRWPRGPKPAE